MTHYLDGLGKIHRFSFNGSDGGRGGSGGGSGDGSDGPFRVRAELRRLRAASLRAPARLHGHLRRGLRAQAHLIPATRGLFMHVLVCVFACVATYVSDPLGPPGAVGS